MLLRRDIRDEGAVHLDGGGRGRARRNRPRGRGGRGAGPGGLLATHVHHAAAEDLVHLPRGEGDHEPALTVAARHKLVLVVHELTRLHVAEADLEKKDKYQTSI